MLIQNIQCSFKYLFSVNVISLHMLPFYLVHNIRLMFLTYFIVVQLNYSNKFLTAVNWFCQINSTKMLHVAPRLITGTICTTGWSN
jgi:hypothetical protein